MTGATLASGAGAGAGAGVEGMTVALGLRLRAGTTGAAGAVDFTAAGAAGTTMVDFVFLRSAAVAFGVGTVAEAFATLDLGAVGLAGAGGALALVRLALIDLSVFIGL